VQGIKARALLEELAAPPWYSAVCLGPVVTAKGHRILVTQGNARRLVGVTEGVPAESLQKGDEVYLGNRLNVVMAKSPYGLTPCGEVGTLERRMEDGRLVLNVRGDETIVVEAAEVLAAVDLQPGDLLRWQRESWMAFEKLPQAEENEFLLEDVPEVGRDRVGGQDAPWHCSGWAVVARADWCENSGGPGREQRRSEAGAELAEAVVAKQEALGEQDGAGPGVLGGWAVPGDS